MNKLIAKILFPIDWQFSSGIFRQQASWYLFNNRLDTAENYKKLT